MTPNWIIQQQEFLAVVFVLEKFRPYLLGSKTVIFTDYSALKYLMTKKEAKAQLIRWILLLQELDLEIWDKRGIENVVTDHLSQILNALIIPALINEDFPDEHILAIFKEPWYADIVNFLAIGQLPTDWTKQDQYSFFAQERYFFWEEQYLFKYCPDHIIRHDAYQRRNRGVCSAFAMTLHVEDTSVPARLQRRFL